MRASGPALHAACAFAGGCLTGGDDGGNVWDGQRLLAQRRSSADESRHALDGTGIRSMHLWHGPGGAQLATGHANGTVCCWDAAAARTERQGF